MNIYIYISFFNLFWGIVIGVIRSVVKLPSKLSFVVWIVLSILRIISHPVDTLIRSRQCSPDMDSLERGIGDRNRGEGGGRRDREGKKQLK